MLTTSLELPVTAEPEAIWAHYHDFDLRKTWETDLEAYALDGDFRAGVTGTMRLTGLPPIHFTLTRVEPQNLFWDEVVLPGMGVLQFGHEISVRHGQRYVRHTIVFLPEAGEVGEREMAFFKQVSGDLADVLWRLKIQTEQR